VLKGWEERILVGLAALCTSSTRFLDLAWSHSLLCFNKVCCVTRSLLCDTHHTESLTVSNIYNFFLLQTAGWVTPLIVIVLFMFISGWAGTIQALHTHTHLASTATCLIEAMRALPGNDQFQQRIEYSTLVRHYFGRYNTHYTLPQQHITDPSQANSACAQ
jgi:hypothetical protein